MSIPEFVNSTPRESAYLSKLKQQCFSIRREVYRAKNPPKLKNDKWSELVIFGIMISFIPSCYASAVQNDGEILPFLVALVFYSVMGGFGFAVCIKDSTNREHSEWTPEKGEKKAKKIARQRNLDEKENLLSIFEKLQQYDKEIDEAKNANEILNIKNSVSLFQRKVFATYQEIFRDEKSKSTKRYSKSVVYNRLLDGNYSASDHVRATKRIQKQEQSRLEGFVIALAHIDRSLIWADELLSKFSN